MTSSAAPSESSFRRRRAPRPRVVAAIVRRDYLLTRSYRMTFALELVFGVVNLLVYFFISRIFPQVGVHDLHGAASYFDFAAVGIIVTVVIGATSTELANRVRQEQLTGTLEALFMQPLATVEVALGLVGLPFLFAMVRAFFYTGIAAIWLGLDVAQASWVGASLALAATGAAMASLGVLAGAIVLMIKRGDLLTGMTLFAMGFVSGAVFPVSVLPAWLQPIGAVVPTRFAFDGLRQALFEGSGWHGEVIALALFAIVTLPVAVAVFRVALWWSKRSGSLAKY
ncbi:MAG: ABC transporter permease [Thermoleophilia bacterium]|nr:ABC transporter permease [Thermoleophilia bacterium]